MLIRNRAHEVLQAYPQTLSETHVCIRCKMRGLLSDLFSSSNRCFEHWELPESGWLAE